MNDIIINKAPVTSQIFENFRYDLIKLVIFILIFAATIIYANSESGKYYSTNPNKTSLLKK
jgi:hypothetical protein